MKNKRFELGLLQKDIADIIGVCEDSITYWENNRSKPSVAYYPKIIEFLGCVPFEIDDSTLGGKIKLYRYLNGLTQEELAAKLDINESTVFHYEKNNHKPAPNVQEKLEFLLATSANATQACRY